VKRLLVVYRGDGLLPPHFGQLTRDANLEVQLVDSLDHARRQVKEDHFDAVLLDAAQGYKQLSLASFLRLLRALPGAPPRVLVFGDAVPGCTAIAPGGAERVADQVFAVLGLARSALFDARVVESLGFSGRVQLELVTLAGTPAPLVRARIERSCFERQPLLAQRAGAVVGPGLARTVEVFWDDPYPHLLQVVPPGESLERLRRLRPRRRLGLELALAVGRGLAEGLVTLHAAGFSIGVLGPAAVWLADSGEVLLLGHGLTQLPVGPFGAGTPEGVPPEELGLEAPPHLGGDAFRLGWLLLDLALEDNPLRRLSLRDLLQRTWQLDLRPLGPAAPLFELMLQPESVDRPRGELLRQALDALAPRERTHLVADAVAWARTQPRLHPWS
jgi:hypothetical protein